MGLRKFKPNTAGTRTLVLSDFSELTTNKPEKVYFALSKGLVDVII